MYLRLISLVFVLLISSFSEAQVVDPSYLEKAPLGTRVRSSGEEIPDGGAGVYLYGIMEGPRLLLGEEKDGIYCPLAGSSQFKADHKAEVFSETALRELAEESAKLYLLTVEDLKKGDFYLQTNKKGGMYLFVFLKTDKIFNTEDLKKAQQGLSGDYLEKKNLKWVPFQALLHKAKGEQSISYGGETLRLQKQFSELCEEENFRGLMRTILERESFAKKAA